MATLVSTCGLAESALHGAVSRLSFPRPVPEREVSRGACTTHQRGGRLRGFRVPGGHPVRRVLSQPRRGRPGLRLRRLSSVYRALERSPLTLTTPDGLSGVVFFRPHPYPVPCAVTARNVARRFRRAPSHGRGPTCPCNIALRQVRHTTDSPAASPSAAAFHSGHDRSASPKPAELP